MIGCKVIGCSDFKERKCMFNGPVCKYQMDSENIICPFCNNTGFDKCGLKNHILYNCEDFHKTESISNLFQ